MRRDLSQGFINILCEWRPQCGPHLEDGLHWGLTAWDKQRANARQAGFSGSILSTRFDFQLIATLKINMS